MKLLIQILTVIALTLTIFLMGVAARFAIVSEPQLELTVRDLPVTLAKVDETVDQASQTIAKVNAATDAEMSSIQSATDEARKTERSIRAGVDSLRQVFIDVHQRIIPQLSKGIGDADSSQRAITTGVLSSLTHTDKTLDSVTSAVSNPAISQSLDNLATTTRNTAQITTDGVATVAKVRQGVTYEVDELMKPISKLRAIAEFAARMAGRFLGL